MPQDPRWDLDVGPDPKAVAFLEGKGLKRSWRWTSMWEREHAFGFTLAGVHRLDVIAGAKQLVTEAVAQGETLEGFRAAFEDRLQKLGFAGPQTVDEFDEGPRKVNLSAGWRTRVIYDTNVRQAYASAEWQAIVDSAADFPALQYRHTPQEHPRLQHLAWDKLVLPVTHEFWKTHFPPNGWYCKCWTLQVSVDELAGGDVKLSTAEQLRATGYTPNTDYWGKFRDPRTGREARVPDGISPGFGYNAGLERRRNLGDLLERRVAGMDEDLARAAAADLVNLPVFQDLAADAVRLGRARAAARAAAAKLKGGSASKGEVDQAAQEAADHAGTFPPDSWPVGVAPEKIAALEPTAPRVVVANASAIGHSADQHPTEAPDWRRVQLLLERGEVWRAGSGDLKIFGQFQDGDGEPRTWALALKPVDGAWRVRTLFPTSPRRRARLVAGAALMRAALGLIQLVG